MIEAASILGAVLLAWRGWATLRAVSRPGSPHKVQERRLGTTLDQVKDAYVEGRISIEELEDHLAVVLGGELDTATKDLLRAEREAAGWAQLREGWEMPEHGPYGSKRLRSPREYDVVWRGGKSFHRYADGRMVQVADDPSIREAAEALDRVYLP